LLKLNIKTVPIFFQIWSFC